MRILYALAILVLLASPVVALEHLTADNFDTRHTISPEEDYYVPRDTVTITYTISPRTESDAVKIMGDVDKPRYYDVYTNLEDTKWKVVVDYVNGPRIYPEVKDGEKHAVVEVKYWYSESGKGLKQIQINLTGKIPKIDNRTENLKVIWFKVSEADDDALPPIEIFVVNVDLFSADISKIREKVANLNDRINDYKKKGYDMSKAEDYLKLAKDSLSSAESLFTKKKFTDADEKLNYAEDYLVKAEEEINKSIVRYDYENLKSSYEELESKIVEIEYYIKYAKEKGFDVVSYEIELTKLKTQAADISGKIDDVEEYMNKDEYDLAAEKIKDIKDELASTKSVAETLLASLSKLKGEEKKEESILEKFAKLFSGSIIMYIALAVVVCVAVIVVYAVRRRGGRWDELR